ncbi:uncharacterized protein NESG_01726 [Nematocida ausubeli]|uniref:Uncharacterized protein n=1 Tax=Nematocida ausubeli (strain ATCC PRA-371 / ERTm2) TaxID=1913371 RepID=A0A086J0S4_NEMA1|nr:uncharacterized protein NESG_01726 [Nematocida ausubeli]KAI5132802.1 hypothetical protein NEAUS06_0348 [Nematocida ausubeli]KFG25742.1 hypothetical protein NESG_01726 [Nematocida ausubeli]
MESAPSKETKLAVSAKVKVPNLQEQHEIWKNRKILFRRLNSPHIKTAKKATRIIEKSLKDVYLRE